MEDLRRNIDSTAKKAKDTAETVAQRVKDVDWQEYYDEAKEKAQDGVYASTQFVKHHPLSSIAGAAFIGFVLGRIGRMKH